MAKYAQVKNGIVENLVEWDGESEFPQDEGVELIALGDDLFAEIGGTVKPKQST